MRIEKRYLYLTETEWRVMLLALNEMRSKLIAQGRYTDAVDEIIMKMAELGFQELKVRLHDRMPLYLYNRSYSLAPHSVQ